MQRYTPTSRSRVKRYPKRGHYDVETVHAILDAGFVCHVGYVIDAQPYVTPTLYWRSGNRLYWHGSSASRMIRSLEDGVECCLTVTHVDALVLARSGFHHSMNYRAVMAFGKAKKIDDPDEKLAALEAFVERMYPQRWKQLRPVQRKELKATTVLSMPIDEASAKVRSGPPIDDDADYALPIWAGLVPLRQVADAPIDDGRLAKGTKRPRLLDDWTHIGAHKP